MSPIFGIERAVSDVRKWETIFLALPEQYPTHRFLFEYSDVKSRNSFKSGVQMHFGAWLLRLPQKSPGTIPPDRTD